MFEYIYLIPPIDSWDNAIVASEKETMCVLDQMPESPRDGVIYKTHIPYDGKLITIYMCKADNDGDVYIFSHEDFVSFYSHLIRRI